MAVTQPPNIATPPVAPQRNDRTTFSNRVDAFVTWLILATSQFLLVAQNVYANALDAAASALSAVGAATAAMTAASVAQSATGAALWNALTNYAQGETAISPLNVAQAYRRRTAGISATDPSLDPVNWAPVQIGLTTTSTLTDTTVLNAGTIGYHLLAMTAVGKSVTLPPASSVATGGPRVVLDNTAGDYPVGILDGAGNCLGQVIEGELVTYFLADNSTSAGVWATSDNVDPWWVTAEVGLSPFASNIKSIKIDEDRSLYFSLNASNAIVAYYVAHPANGTLAAGAPYVVFPGDVTAITDGIVMAGNRMLVRNGTKACIIDYSAGAVLNIGAPTATLGVVPSTNLPMLNMDGRYAATYQATGTQVRVQILDCGANGVAIAVGARFDASPAAPAAGGSDGAFMASAVVDGTHFGVLFNYPDTGGTYRALYLNTFTIAGTTVTPGAQAPQPTGYWTGGNVGNAWTSCGALSTLVRYATGANSSSLVVASFGLASTFGAAAATSFNTVGGFQSPVKIGASTFIIDGDSANTIQAMTIAGSTINLGSPVVGIAGGGTSYITLAASDGKGLVQGTVAGVPCRRGFAVSGNTIALGSFTQGRTAANNQPYGADSIVLGVADGAVPVRAMTLLKAGGAGSVMAYLSIDSLGNVSTTGITEPTDLPAMQIMPAQASGGRVVGTSTGASVYKTPHGVLVNGRWKIGYSTGVSAKAGLLHFVQNSTSALFAFSDSRFDRNQTIGRVRYAER